MSGAGIMAHSCNIIYLGSMTRKMVVSDQLGQKGIPCLKNKLQKKKVWGHSSSVRELA
jgi:hypothetical protein